MHDYEVGHLSISIYVLIYANMHLSTYIYIYNVVRWMHIEEHDFMGGGVDIYVLTRFYIWSLGIAMYLLCRSTYLSIISIYMSTYQSLSLSLSLSICLSFLFVNLYLCMYASIYPSIHSSIHPYICIHLILIYPYLYKFMKVHACTCDYRRG